MTELHPDDRKKLGQVLGMKPSEIVAAAETDDLYPAALVVETHDGKRVLLTPADDDGATYTVTPWDGPMPDEVVGEDESELDDQDGAVVEPGDVPDGSVEVVLAWVGEDRARAALALAAEKAREKPRAVVGQLEKLAQA